MAVPTFVAAGVAAAGTGALTPGLPAGLAENDVMLLHVETANEPPGAITDWLQVPDSPNGTGAAGGLGSVAISVWWRRATSSEVAPTIPDPGDHGVAVITAYRGCVTTGNPYDVTVSNNDGTTSSTAVSVPGDTTTVNDCLVVAAVAGHTNGSVGSWVNADLANVVEVADVFVDGPGNDGLVAAAAGEKATAGAFGATTATASVSIRQAHHAVALVGASGGTPILVDVDPAAEQETAGVVDPQIRRAVPVVAAGETELGHPITAVLNRVVPVGAASETELGQPVAPVLDRAVTVGQATETEAGQTVTPVKPVVVDVLTAIETELGLTVNPVGSNQTPVGQAVEAETAQPFTTSRSVPVGQAAETELAAAVDAVLDRQVQVGQVTEIELGGVVSPAQARFVPFGQATEVETAQAFTVPGVGRLAPIVCQVADPTAVCSVAAPTAACSISTPSAVCS